MFFDEVIPQKIIVQELTTPETLKLDLLIQTKTLSEKVNRNRERDENDILKLNFISHFIDAIISNVDGCQSVEFR